VVEVVMKMLMTMLIMMMMMIIIIIMLQHVDYRSEEDFSGYGAT
jgi:preprotein translocase subunit SecG